MRSLPLFAHLAVRLIDAGQSLASGERLDALWVPARRIAAQVGLARLLHRPAFFDVPGR